MKTFSGYIFIWWSYSTQRFELSCIQIMLLIENLENLSQAQLYIWWNATTLWNKLLSRSLFPNILHKRINFGLLFFWFFFWWNNTCGRFLSDSLVTLREGFRLSCRMVTFRNLHRTEYRLLCKTNTLLIDYSCIQLISNCSFGEELLAFKRKLFASYSQFW